jgi:F-type H+-transporting ATPase subunit epsilon
MSKLTVNVVTPAGQLAEVTTNAVTAPGELGEFEVLPGHIPFLTELHAGVLVLGEKPEPVHRFATANGFLRVNHEGEVEVLVEQGMAAEDIDADAATEELRELRPQVAAWTKGEDAEYKNLKARHDWALARVDAAAAGRSSH